jgi:hypothetical protein
MTSINGRDEPPINDHLDGKLPATASAQSKPAPKNIPLSQCNNQLASILDECEKIREDEIREENNKKKRKVTPSKKDQPTSLPSCQFCNKNKYHKIKFGGYCLSKAFQYCDRKENRNSIDWITCSYIYNDAYKEIWRVCTYLDTDYYDPDDSILDIPQCMAEGSYKQAKEVVKCKISLNRVQMFFWDGAMKNDEDLNDWGGSGGASSDDGGDDENTRNGICIIFLFFFENIRADEGFTAKS